MNTTTLRNLQAEQQGTHCVRPAVALPVSSAAAGLELAPLRDPRHQGEPLHAADPLLDGSASAAAGGRTYTRAEVFDVLYQIEAHLQRRRFEALGGGNAVLADGFSLSSFIVADYMRLFDIPGDPAIVDLKVSY